MAHVDEIRTLGVLGAGQMGSGIAQVGAACGLQVVLVDASLELAEKGKKKITGALDRQVAKGKMAAADRDALSTASPSLGAPKRSRRATSSSKRRRRTSS